MHNTVLVGGTRILAATLESKDACIAGCIVRSDSWWRGRGRVDADRCSAEASSSSNPLSCSGGKSLCEGRRVLAGSELACGDERVARARSCESSGPAVGFEPTAYRLQVGCATGLRHAGLTLQL